MDNTHFMKVYQMKNGKYVLVIDAKNFGKFKTARKAWKFGHKIIGRILDAERKRNDEEENIGKS